MKPATQGTLLGSITSDVSIADFNANFNDNINNNNNNINISKTTKS